MSRRLGPWYFRKVQNAIERRAVLGHGEPGQAAFLDKVAAAIRCHTGKSISRSAMIRAIADAVLPLYPDWFACRSEDEIKERITFQISRGAGARTAMPTANR